MPWWRKLLIFWLAGGGVLIWLMWLGLRQVLAESHGRLDGTGVAAQISGRLTDLAGGQHVYVSCPADQPVQAGYIFDCTARDTASATGYLVRVTENDSRGHFTWQVTSQPAP